MNESESNVLFEILNKLPRNESAGAPVSLVEQKLDEHEGWQASNDLHCLTRQDVLALMAALGSGRPLLITGEPGCGKSSMARAFASLLKYDFFASMIKPGDTHESLLWRIDHVERLAQAHIQSKPGDGSTSGEKNSLALRNFLSKGEIWQAFENTAKKGTVLLLDEADKAELTLVNGLLDVLGEGSFTGPENETISKSLNHNLLVVVTSNGDRPMPPAVIRRCTQHNLMLPENPDQLTDYLGSIGAAKFPDLKDGTVLNDAAITIVNKRVPNATVQPGISEYVDLLRVWQQIAQTQGNETADSKLSELSAFFIKQAR